MPQVNYYRDQRIKKSFIWGIGIIPLKDLTTINIKIRIKLKNQKVIIKIRKDLGRKTRRRRVF